MSLPLRVDDDGHAVLTNRHEVVASVFAVEGFVLRVPLVEGQRDR